MPPCRWPACWRWPCPAGAARRLWAWAGTPRGVLVAALPTAVSVVVEWITGWTDPGLRAATGAVLGFAGAGLVCASLAVAAGANRRRAAAASADRVKRLPGKYARLRKLHAP